MKGISLLGSTGSIGTNVLDIVRKYPQKYRIVALAAGRNVQLLAEQVVEFEPELVSVVDEKSARQLQGLLPRRYSSRISYGTEGMELVATAEGSHITISAIVGAAGLLPTLAAIQAGKDIGLANKETLVMAGKLVMDAVREKGVQLLPIDSEHSAIFQALEAGRRADLRRIILTASGGPFYGTSRDQLQKVTSAQALAHPNWDMGPKISIDSATLMNKGLEVIEARWLFDVGADAIEVTVHPQSIVHSLVEYLDGSVIAQLGVPDMRIPIAYALSYPERMNLGLSSLDLFTCGELEFFKPDRTCFPALQLAFDALEAGGTMPAVLNAANEIAVEAFLQGRIGFLQIAETVAQTLERVPRGDEDSLAAILEADTIARGEAARRIAA